MPRLSSEPQQCPPLPRCTSPPYSGRAPPWPWCSRTGSLVYTRQPRIHHSLALSPWHRQQTFTSQYFKTGEIKGFDSFLQIVNQVPKRVLEYLKALGNEVSVNLWQVQEEYTTWKAQVTGNFNHDLRIIQSKQQISLSKNLRHTTAFYD